MSDHEREVEALQREVPQLQARAETLSGELRKAEEVRRQGLWSAEVKMTAAAGHLHRMLLG